MKIPAKFFDKRSGKAERKEYIWLVNTILRARKLCLCCGILLLFTACGNKTQKSEPVVYGDQYFHEQSLPDTMSSVQEESSKTAAPVSSSSSLSRQSDTYDNMRGFDPASEDDMDDNGMSRYMENNDEEGWD